MRMERRVYFCECGCVREVTGLRGLDCGDFGGGFGVDN